MLHSYTQTFIQRAQEDGSVVSFGITITYPLDKDLNESWALLKTRISEILKPLHPLPIYCLLLSVEIHKEGVIAKTSKKRRPNHQSRLRGRPHIHICLMLYNDFLCPSISKLEESLRSPSNLNFDLQIKHFVPDDSTKGKFNIKNWFLYCLKENKDLTSQRFLKKYLKYPTSSFLISGHPDSYKACDDLASVFNQCHYNLFHVDAPDECGEDNELSLTDTTLINRLPFVPQTNSEVLKVSVFLSPVLKRLNLAIWPGKTHLCKLRFGAKATWQEFISLSQLYTLILEKFPIKTQELLMQSRAFNLYTRDYNKLNFNWLPQVIVSTYLFEFGDGIYNLRTGEFKPHSEIKLGLVSCSTFWPEIRFQDLDGLKNV